MEAAVLMVNLFEFSSTMRSVFTDQETERKNLHTQLRDLRVKVKQ